MKALILCEEGLEECEALVTRNLLYRAKIDVLTAGPKKEITSSRKLTFTVDRLFDEVKDELFDCLILPGGIPGTNNLEKNEIVQKMIDNHIKNDKYVAAICAAPSILIHKGLIKDNCFTCSPGFENNLTKAQGKAVVDNKIITARGLGASFEFGYEIIKSLLNEETAQEVLNKIGY